MQEMLRKLWDVLTHVQVLLVVFSFSLMVFFSYNFMSDIERKHLLDKVNSSIQNTQDKISADLLESEMVLSIITETVRGMILEINNYEMIREYLNYISAELSRDTRLQSRVLNIYSVFDIYDGSFYDSSGAVSQNDFYENNFIWYFLAVGARGNIIRTEPVIDKENNKVTISFARRIFDNNNDPLGVICLVVSIDEIRKLAIAATVTEDSYGILLDKDLNVIAHPSCFNDDIAFKYLGGNLKKMNDGEAIAEILLRGEEISERKVWDYNRNESVGFFRLLDNGWHLAIIAYANKYYQSVNEIGAILVVLGLIFAIILCSILLSMTYSKKRAEERTRIMLNTTPLCANFWNEKFQNIDCNEEALRLFGLSSKKEYLTNFFEFSPEYQPDGRLSKDKALEFVKKGFEEGYFRFEWMHRKMSGELIPCEVTLVRVNYRKGYMVAGYTRDLREIKAIMAKMREADECTQVLFDATPLSCFMLDNKLNIVECNQEIINLLGIQSKQDFFERVYDFFPQYQPSGVESREQIIKYIDEAFEEGKCRFEWMYQKLDGEQIPTEVALVRVKFRGDYAVAGYVRDLRELKAMIAEMRRAEIAEESSKAKSDFLAKMSHEIRTPMNAILGITEIQLQDSALPLATKEALERIYNSGDLLLGIINDILDLSKIEAGKLELSLVQYDIASLIHDTVKLNVMRYESKPINFKLDVGENVPAKLTGDELRIKQILNNLLSNAFKYTQEGLIELTLSAEMQDDRKNVNLFIKVSDTGQGMTVEQVKKLGDKFSRFNLEANRKTEGTGLGMNITRNLIQLMSGDISIESNPGRGSVFTVRLPQGCVSEEPIGKELADNLMKLNLKNTTKMRNAQITQDFMPYGRVLVIDDVETNLYVARGLMAPYGLSLDTGMSGFEAVDKIRDGASYDIIFMDHMMPRMDGIEATKLIRSLEYNRPIVALTANALAGQAEMFLSNGFDDFISKPIDIRQLNSVLNKMIRDKQTDEVLEEARKQKNSLYAAGKHNIAIDPQLGEIFIRDAKKAVTLLQNIFENNYRREDDIGTFIINVHSMKSALANVGEGILSDKAAELEKAGRDLNMNLILASLPGFLESLKKVIEKLDHSDDESSDEENEIGNSEKSAFLKEQLSAVCEACKSLDKKAAKKAIASLKQENWSKGTREKLSAISERLLHSEFEEAAAIAGEFLA